MIYLSLLLFINKEYYTYISKLYLGIIKIYYQNDYDK